MVIMLKPGRRFAGAEAEADEEREERDRLLDLVERALLDAKVEEEEGVDGVYVSGEKEALGAKTGE